MRKLLLQVCLSLNLLTILTGVSAQAQTLTRYTAQIPFDFQIGNKVYQAGEYVIDLRKQSLQAVWSLKLKINFYFPRKNF